MKLSRTSHTSQLAGKNEISYGVFFYLIGSLLFFFQMASTNNFTVIKTSGILVLLILFSIFLLYVVQPIFS